MTTEKLTTNDKKNLKSELVQLILAFIFVGIILTIVLSTLITFLNNSKIHFWKSNQAMCTIAIILFTFFIWLVFVAMKIKNPLQDLLAGSKHCITAPISDKHTNTKYSYHANVVADLVSKPRLIEYFLIIGNTRYNVDEVIYNSFEVGDKAKVSFTVGRNKFIGIETDI